MTRAAEVTPITSSESNRVRRTGLRHAERTILRILDVKQTPITFVRQPWSEDTRTAVDNTLLVDQRKISEMGTGPIQYNINIQYVLSTVRLQNTALSEADI